MVNTLASSDYCDTYDLNKSPLFGRRPPLLPSLVIELTERCNNNCVHCYINLPRNDAKAISRELTTGEWKDILNQAAEMGVLAVHFTGGEPLLRDDFAELYLHARHLGMRVLLFTNGRCITPELAEMFSRIPPLEKIEVTVYGMQPTTYDAVARCPGAFDEFWRGVQLLLQRKVPFIVKGALLPQNKGDRERFEAWAQTIPWMEGTPSYSMFFEMRGRRDSGKKNENIAQLRTTPEDGLSVLTRDEIRYRKDMAQFCQKYMGASGIRLFSCGAGLSLSIDAYGIIQPCLRLRMPELCYDIRKGSLKEALTVFFPRIREILAENPDYLERCANCFIKGLCEQCPAKSWSEHGTLDTPVDYYCAIAHEQARYLGLIEPGESAWEVTNGKERIERVINTLLEGDTGKI